jgi:hypothetical protein
LFTNLDDLQGLTLKKHIDATLGQGNIKEAVRLPPGEDLNEWLAVNTVDFYNAISVLHGTLEEFCTPSVCPAMAAGAKVHPSFHFCMYQGRGGTSTLKKSHGWIIHAGEGSSYASLQPDCLKQLDGSGQIYLCLMLQRNHLNGGCLQYEYLWADGVRVKTPVKLSAPDYINALFDWVEAQVENTSYTHSTGR